MRKNSRIINLDHILEEFKNKLLESPAGPSILKIVLFGSHAKGKPKRESDIDVLILTNNGNKVWEGIFDVVFDIQTSYGVGLEPIICSVDDLFPLKSYFLYNVMSYGREVYSVEKEKIKGEERKSLLF